MNPDTTASNEANDNNGLPPSYDQYYYRYNNFGRIAYSFLILAMFFSLFWSAKVNKHNRVGLMSFFMGIGFTSSALPFYGRFEDFRTAICFVQGGLFLTAIGM
jgi:hypothetical protein